MTGKTLTTAVAVAVGLGLVGYFFFSNPFSTEIGVIPQQSASPDQVIIQEVVEGTGAMASAGSTVRVNYIGKLQDGTTFDQSADHGGAQTFSLGRVVPGFAQGIQGMKVGGTRIIIIPPSLGYGAQPVGSIPANSTLIFQVELVEVAQPSAQ